MISMRFGRVTKMAVLTMVSWVAAAPVQLIASPLQGDVLRFEPEKKYSPEVAAKADRILLENGFQRSGNQIKTTKTSAIQRGLTQLIRKKRNIRQARKDWETSVEATRTTRAKIRELTQKQAQLNLELVRVAGRDISANNRLVGLIKSNEARIALLLSEVKEREQFAAQKRAVLTDAEAEYESSVLSIGQSLDTARSELTSALAKQEVQTAMKVAHTNFETPFPVVVDDLLQTTQKRMDKVEQTVFRQAIDLAVENRTFKTDVAVGDKRVRMVVDSGADLVTLTPAAAKTLGIQVPAGAPKVRLILADGRQTLGRRVTLPKLRVGSFEADNVEAVVLSTATAGAASLLGMSYLGNFKFEIDTANRQLKLLRIDQE